MPIPALSRCSTRRLGAKSLACPASRDARNHSSGPRNQLLRRANVQRRIGAQAETARTDRSPRSLQVRIQDDAVSSPLALRGCPNFGKMPHRVISQLSKVREDSMPKLLLLTVATAALLATLATLAPRVEATTSVVPASIQIAVGKTSLLEQAGMACTHRRVCRQGAGCAWRKVCKRW